MNDNNENNNNNTVVQKQNPERFDFQNAGLNETGTGYSRQQHPYIIFVDSKGKKFNELSYTNLGQFYVVYKIDKKNKSFESVYKNAVVERFNNEEEANDYIKKLKKSKGGNGEYIVRHEFVYQLSYGLIHEIEYDKGRATNVMMPETDMIKVLPLLITDLIRIGFGWQPSDDSGKYKVINLYKITGEHTYTAGIFIEDYAIYTEGAKNEQDAQKVISEWQGGKIQYKVVQGTQHLGKLAGNISEEKYNEGEILYIRPQNVLLEELLNPKSIEHYKRGGYLRTKAKEMNLLTDDNDTLSDSDLCKIEQLGGVWQRRVKLTRQLRKMESGGGIKKEDDDKLQEPIKIPTIEDEVRKYANDKNEVSTSNLKLVLGGKDPEYPIHTVGTITLKKCFMKPYYKIIDSII